MTRLPAAQRREQLLDCAADLFARNGYARATTSELAKAAGVTEPVIYRHFKSKKELFVALIERTGERSMQAWRDHLKDAPDAGERLRRLIGDNPMVSPRQRAAYRVVLQSISEADDPQIVKALSDHITSMHAFLRDEVERAQDEHRVTARFSGELIAWLLIYIGLGYGVASAMGVPGHGVDMSGRHVQEVLARILVGPGRRDAEGP
ncbi:MAG: TetR/AcrR family transcriptional regulator [Phycisphaerales bacterium]|jgi:AcrR family transcriptional regulator|nr:TetR/AcrR family transcriptional regulator [Phycisphaerales bacterium]